MYAKLRQEVGVLDKWGDKVLVIKVDQSSNMCFVVDDEGHVTAISLSRLVCSQQELKVCLAATSNMERSRVRDVIRGAMQAIALETQVARGQSNANPNQQIPLSPGCSGNGFTIATPTRPDGYTMYCADSPVYYTFTTTPGVGPYTSGR